MKEKEQTALKQALKSAMLEEFADIPPEEEIDIKVSEHFCRACEKLIRQNGQEPVRKIRHSVRRVVLVAALLSALAISVFAIPVVRDTVVRFFVRDEGKFYEFSFDPEQAATAPKFVEKTYRATYIPEGFTDLAEDSSLSGRCQYWTNAEEKIYIMFDQTVIGGIDKVPYGDESVSEVLNLDGYQVFCIRDEAIKYFWTDNEYFFSLYCGPGISEAEMRKIFRGLEAEQENPLA